MLAPLVSLEISVSPLFTYCGTVEMVAGIFSTPSAAADIGIKAAIIANASRVETRRLLRFIFIPPEGSAVPHVPQIGQNGGETALSFHIKL